MWGRTGAGSQMVLEEAGRWAGGAGGLSVRFNTTPTTRPAEVTSGKAQIHPSIERSTPTSCLPSRVVPHRPVVVFCNSFGI